MEFHARILDTWVKEKRLSNIVADENDFCSSYNVYPQLASLGATIIGLMDRRVVSLGEDVGGLKWGDIRMWRVSVVLFLISGAYIFIGLLIINAQELVE